MSAVNFRPRKHFSRLNGGTIGGSEKRRTINPTLVEGVNNGPHVCKGSHRFIITKTIMSISKIQATKTTNEFLTALEFGLRHCPFHFKMSSTGRGPRRAFSGEWNWRNEIDVRSETIRVPMPEGGLEKLSTEISIQVTLKADGIDRLNRALGARVVLQRWKALQGVADEMAFPPNDARSVGLRRHRRKSKRSVDNASTLATAV